MANTPKIVGKTTCAHSLKVPLNRADAEAFRQIENEADKKNPAQGWVCDFVQVE